MDINELRAQIKRSIANITGMDPEQIADTALYKEDLALDSLSIIEIVVDVEYKFQIRVPEKEWSDVRTVEDTVQTVQKYLCTEVV